MSIGRLRPFLVCALVAACSGGSGRTRDAGVRARPVVAAPARAPVPTTPPAIAVHEWGLVSFRVAEASPLAFARTGPSAPTRGGLGHGGGGGTGQGLKPVLYVHLPAGAPAVDLEFLLPREQGFRAIEQWPPAADARASGWAVRARHESCAGRGYPTPDSADCETVDGICEASAARAYETTDAACLEVEGAPANHLFYRAAVARRALPVDVVLRGGERTVERLRGGDSIPMLRVARTATTGELRVASFEAPRSGSMPLPPPSAAAADDVRARFFDPLDALGLSAEERRVFERVWAPAIFGEARPSTPAPSDPTDAGSIPPEDAVYYYLPESSVAAILPVAIEPRPASFRRAILVRVDLSPPPRRRLPSEDEPRVTMTIAGTLAVSGGRSESHRRVVLEGRDALLACTESAIGAGRRVNGRSTVRYTVSSAGRVESVAIVDDSILDPVVSACIEATLAGFEFPTPTSPTAIGRVPLEFATH